ncbi:type II toxin-antitoxin system VapC family toxin [Streptomyces canus]
MPVEHELPAEMAISAITLAELSAGPHQVRSGEQSDYDEHAERARRRDVLQRAENEFDPIPFGVEAACIYGRICAAVVSTGRKPRRPVADLMIAAPGGRRGIPPVHHHPDDFKGLDDLITIVPVTRPEILPDRLHRA